MADYSGHRYDSCNECRQAGVAPPGVKHLSTCSVPAKIAKIEAENARRKLEKQRAEEELKERVKNMDDLTLIQELTNNRLIVFEKQNVIRELNRFADKALDEVYSRNLAQDYMKHLEDKMAQRRARLKKHE